MYIGLTYYMQLKGAVWPQHIGAYLEDAMTTASHKLVYVYIQQEDKSAGDAIHPALGKLGSVWFMRLLV